MALDNLQVQPEQTPSLHDEAEYTIHPRMVRAFYANHRLSSVCRYCTDRITCNDKYYICHPNGSLLHSDCFPMLIYNYGMKNTGELNFEFFNDGSIVEIQAQLHYAILSFEKCNFCWDKIPSMVHYFKINSCGHNMCVSCYPKHIKHFGVTSCGKIRCDLCISKLIDTI